jgi:hypothetical protein
MFKQFAALCIAALSPSTASAQVYASNGKPIANADEYVKIVQNTRAEPSGHVKYYYTYRAEGDTTGTWRFKDTGSIFATKKLKQAMWAGLEEMTLRDSTGAVLPLDADETKLFNAMSKSGYEFLKKDAAMPTWFGTTLLNIVPYTFKKRR